MKNKNVVVKKDCHSQMFLLGISHIRFREWVKQFKQVGAPRQNSSGMTPLCNHGGFTLIELLVVVLIIGILAAVAVPQYQKAVIKSRVAEAKIGLSALQKATHIAQLETSNPYAPDLDQLSIELPISNNWDYMLEECTSMHGCLFEARGKNLMDGHYFYLTDKDYDDGSHFAGFNCQNGGIDSADYDTEINQCKKMGFTKEYDEFTLIE